MPKLQDLSGQRFGRFVVVEHDSNHGMDETGRIRHKWICKCDCGNVVSVLGESLKSGKSKSCGCYQKSQTSAANRKHGYSHTRIEAIRNAMVQRCFNTNVERYPVYGGRGIRVCEAWRNDPESFYKWAFSHGYAEDLSIDRIDPDGDYEPSNCRWVSMIVQQNNRRNNKRIKFNGTSHTLKEWSAITGIKRETISFRLKSGWPIDVALSQRPAVGRNQFARS